MSDCLECERLRRQLNKMETKYILQVNRWLELKKWIIAQEESSRENQVSKKG